MGALAPCLWCIRGSRRAPVQGGPGDTPDAHHPLPPPARHACRALVGGARRHPRPSPRIAGAFSCFRPYMMTLRQSIIFAQIFETKAAGTLELSVGAWDQSVALSGHNWWLCFGPGPFGRYRPGRVGWEQVGAGRPGACWFSTARGVT